MEHLPKQVCHVATQTPLEAAGWGEKVWDQVTRDMGRWLYQLKCFTTAHPLHHVVRLPEHSQLTASCLQSPSLQQQPFSLRLVGSQTGI